ncbi:MAG: ATP-binding cassette domain-containing protein [Desulfovibrio sp.]|jgi:phospholipid/cholesterol/gamma-HCH transport system ATP-binding protein|nr:ATP-binding cassette domain-containing protein [Desulfovibrio sp.]
MQTSQTWDIAFSHLDAGYGEHAVLRDISAVLPAGKISVILGESGSGKSTLLKHIMGLSRPMGGQVHIAGQDIFALDATTFRRLRRHMGVLFQDGALLGALDLVENVALPLSEHLSLSPKLLREAALRVLDMVGLEEFADYYPNQLSGGMRKRAGLARAIIAQPRILLCDEPTSGLDPVTAAKMDELLLSMHTQFPEMTIVVVSHDLASFKAVAEHVLVIRDSGLCFVGSPAELLNSADPYLRQFLERRSGDAGVARQRPMNAGVQEALTRWLAS